MANADLQLTKPLGKLFTDVPCNIHHQCCRTRDTVFYRDAESNAYLQYDLKGNCGFFRYSGTTETIPSDAHPIDCRLVNGDKLWMSRPYRQTKCDIPLIAPGHILHNNLDRTKPGTGASEGSLFRDYEVMTAGWLIANNDQQMTAAVFVLSSVSSLSSYRSELEGTFRLLKHLEYLGMKPCKIKHWCDNEGAVQATNTTIHKHRSSRRDARPRCRYHPRNTGTQTEKRHILHLFSRSFAPRQEEMGL